MNIPIIDAPPQWEKTYGQGWTGFTNGPSIVSRAVALFDRDHGAYPSVTHAFIVVSAGFCVEAHMGRGVTRKGLDDYFYDPQVTLYFRKPNCWTPEMGKRIAYRAESLVGNPYDSRLILSKMMSLSIFGRFINRIFHNGPNRLITKLLNYKDKYICNEVVGYAYRGEDALHCGCTARAYEKTPQDTIKCESLYQPFINKIRIGDLS